MDNAQRKAGAPASAKAPTTEVTEGKGKGGVGLDGGGGGVGAEESFWHQLLPLSLLPGWRHGLSVGILGTEALEGKGK